MPTVTVDGFVVFKYSCITTSVGYRLYCTHEYDGCLFCSTRTVITTALVSTALVVALVSVTFPRYRMHARLSSTCTSGSDTFVGNTHANMRPT